MSIWQQYHLFEKIETILRQDAEAYGPHHFGYPSMSAYQLAISLAQTYPDDFQAIKMPLGGMSTGQHNSFAQYIARELSRRINTREITTIAGGFLSNTNLNDIQFKYGSEIIHSSLTGTSFTLSLFRWIG